MVYCSNLKLIGNKTAKEPGGKKQEEILRDALHIFIFTSKGMFQLSRGHGRKNPSKAMGSCFQVVKMMRQVVILEASDGAPKKLEIFGLDLMAC